MEISRFFLFLDLGTVLKNSTPEYFVTISQMDKAEQQRLSFKQHEFTFYVATFFAAVVVAWFDLCR